MTIQSLAGVLASRDLYSSENDDSEETPAMITLLRKLIIHDMSAIYRTRMHQHFSRCAHRVAATLIEDPLLGGCIDIMLC